MGVSGNANVRASAGASKSVNVGAPADASGRASGVGKARGTWWATRSAGSVPERKMYAAGHECGQNDENFGAISDGIDPGGVSETAIETASTSLGLRRNRRLHLCSHSQP
jgi:hypothetical protein